MNFKSLNEFENALKEVKTFDEVLKFIKENTNFVGFVFEVKEDTGCAMIFTNKKNDGSFCHNYDYHLGDNGEIFKKIGDYAIKKFRKEIIPNTIRFQVFKRDHFTCKYCGKSAEVGAILEIDHKIPKSKGGTDNIENLITSCKECNRGKRDKLLNE